MKNGFELLQEQSASVALNREERDQLRESLLTHMEKNPPRKRVSYFGFGSRRAKFAIIIVLIFMLFAGSVIAAASGSVPGDRLYFVQKPVDGVRGYFVRTAPGKINYELSFVNRSLLAVERLEKQSRFDGERKGLVKAYFNGHLKNYTEEFRSYIEGVEPSDAAAMRDNFNKMLRDHLPAFRSLSSPL